MKFTRYAIFYTPDPGPLARFGAAWLGWDPATGHAPPRLELPDLPIPWQDITATPRKYGFHGTLKPPFRLRDTQTETALRTALKAFCAATAPVALDTMELVQLGRFLALVPVGDTPALNALAADIIRAFDMFRAPVSNSELARRWHHHRLTPRQDALLLDWGYPYVMEEFRFHLTLTDKLPKAKAAALRTLLAPRLTPLKPEPFVIDALSLMGEAADGKFHLIDRIALSGRG